MIYCTSFDYNARLLGGSLIWRQTSPSDMKAWWYPTGYYNPYAIHIRPRYLRFRMSNEHAIWWWWQTHGKCIHDIGISLHADLIYCHPKMLRPRTPQNITTSPHVSWLSWLTIANTHNLRSLLLQYSPINVAAEWMSYDSSDQIY